MIAAARLAASVGLLWLVFRYVDGAAVLSRLSSLHVGWVAAGLAVSVLQVVLLAWRWRYTAARLGIDLPFRIALAEYYMGILLNQVLPGGVAGDISRAWRHARSDVPVGSAVRAVLLERLSAQIVMTLVAIASVLSFAWVRAVLRVVLALIVVLLLVGGWISLTDERNGADAGTAAGRLRADARRALLSDGAGLQLVSAIVVVASYVLVFLMSAHAVGIETPLNSLVPLVAPVLMTMLIPVSVAGWGVREAAAAALWAGAGLTAEDGAAVSVTYGLLVLASSAPGLVVLMRATIGDRGRRARPPRA